MTTPDRSELLVRAVALYLPVALIAAAVVRRRPNRRRLAAALVGTAWNIPSLLAVNLVAVATGWWSFRTESATLSGVPVDLWLGWALLWGAFPVLLTNTSRRLVLVAVGLIGLDAVLMPQGQPVVVLHRGWIGGELLAVAACLGPGLLLSRWTATGGRLYGRVALQIVAFTGLLYFVLPTATFELVGGSWTVLDDRPWWLLAVALVAAVPGGVVALLAVREFARHGGTPLPLDPPTDLATAGPYAYIANPMQAGAVVLLGVWGAVLASPGLVAAAGMGVVFSAGFASRHEDEELARRFGDDWRRYRSRVRAWLPSPSLYRVRARAGQMGGQG